MDYFDWGDEGVIARSYVSRDSSVCFRFSNAGDVKEFSDIIVI